VPVPKIGVDQIREKVPKDKRCFMEIKPQLLYFGADFFRNSIMDFQSHTLYIDYFYEQLIRELLKYR
jgi:hypothetical protein